MPVVPVVPNSEPLDCAEVVGLLEKSEGALELVWPAFENMVLGGIEGLAQRVLRLAYTVLLLFLRNNRKARVRDPLFSRVEHGSIVRTSSGTLRQARECGEAVGAEPKA